MHKLILASSFSLALSLAMGTTALPGSAQSAVLPPTPDPQAVLKSAQASGIITGNGFHSDLATSYAQFVEMLLNTILPKSVRPTPAPASDQDTDWFVPIFKKANNLGLPVNASVTRAQATGPITREQAAVLIVTTASRLAALPSGPQAPTQSPADYQDLATQDRDAVMVALGVGFFYTDSRGNFRPRDSVSQGEAAAMMTKLQGFAHAAGRN